MTRTQSAILKSQVRRRWGLLFGIVAVLLLIPGSCAVDPLLYSAKEGSATGFHQDLAATGNVSRDDAALVLQEMATGLNLTGSLTHNIKQREFESAKRELQQLFSSERSLGELVVHLDMTDTDVAAFQLENRENPGSLRELLNQTKEFDDLKDEEAKLRDQHDIAGLKSVDLRGEGLRIRARSNYQAYANRFDPLVNLSLKFGLDTSAYAQSLVDFTAILAEIDAVQDRRSASISGMLQAYQPTYAINLRVLPDRGAYGDTLSMVGTAYAPAGTEVRVFVDGLQAGAVTNGNDGRFSFPYRIEEVEARAHTVYVSAGPDMSNLSYFTVEPRNTTLSLTVHPAEGSGIGKSIGTGRLLTEDGAPVRWAMVSGDVDGQTSSAYGVTGEDGVYNFTVDQLPSGAHSLKARFDPGGFPLNGSESLPVTIKGHSNFDLMASLVYLLVLGGTGFGSVLFLRKRRPADAPPSADTVVSTSASQINPPPVSTIEEARMIADMVTATHEGRIDGYETIAQTYRRLVQELQAKNPDLRLRSQTPRNLALLFADQPFGDQLEALVEIHEKVRYAEREPTDEDLHRARDAFINIITGGSDH